MLIIAIYISNFKHLDSFLKDDLLAELEEMEQAELDEQLLDVETPTSELPELPEVRKCININKKRDTTANETFVGYLGSTVQ